MGSRSGYLVAAAVVSALVLSGCPKKESPEDIEFAAQQAKKAAADAQAKKKASDIFDEFYMDDSKKAAAKADAAKTSPSAAVAVGGGSYNFTKNGRYVVQVNSTASETGANRMVTKLKAAGYPAYAVAVQNPTPELIGTYFRVRIGTFDNMSEAKAFAEGPLTAGGYEYWIDRKANDNVGIQGGGFGSGGQQQYQQPAQQYQQPAQQYQQPAQQYQQPAQQYQQPAQQYQQPAQPIQQYQQQYQQPPQATPPPPAQQQQPAGGWGLEDWGPDD